MYMGEERRVGQRVAVLIAPSALWGGFELYDQCIRFTLELLGITHCRSAGIHTTGGLFSKHSKQGTCFKRLLLTTVSAPSWTRLSLPYIFTFTFENTRTNLKITLFVNITISSTWTLHIWLFSQYFHRTQIIYGKFKMNSLMKNYRETFRTKHHSCNSNPILLTSYLPLHKVTVSVATGQHSLG